MRIQSFGHDRGNFDAIFCYFMRTVLCIQGSRVDSLPLDNNLTYPCKTFLDTAMKVFLTSLPPERFRLILEEEYDQVLERGKITIETAKGLQLIKELVWHVRYDKDYYHYLLSTENQWGDTAIEYARFTFYPNLPEEKKCEYHIPELIKHIPENMLRLDDY